jgi:hypothetical protein
MVHAMVKKAVIVISLVEESTEKANKEIEAEIFKELSECPVKIPWMKKVEKVSVKVLRNDSFSEVAQEGS